MRLEVKTEVKTVKLCGLVARKGLRMGFWDIVMFSFLTWTLTGCVFSVWLLLVAQMVRNSPAIWETQVQSLGQEDPLEKEMATHSNSLVWEIP